MKNAYHDMDLTKSEVLMKRACPDILNRINELAKKVTEKQKFKDRQRRAKFYGETRKAFILNYIQGCEFLKIQKLQFMKENGLTEMYGKFLRLGD